MKIRFLILFVIICNSFSYMQNVKIFTVVHCEPHNSDLFDKLAEIVNLADSNHIPLTIELTPQWGSEIILDPAKINLIRQWQMNGHEIGAHHHGVEAGAGWDGYTDLDTSTLPFPQKYLGTMNDYISILNQVAGDSILLTGGFGSDVDWLPQLKFRTIGHSLDDAISRPEMITIDGNIIYQIRYRATTRLVLTEEMINHFSNANGNDLYGFVSHVFNFRDDQLYLRRWFDFIKDKKNKTVRQIMREENLYTSLDDDSRCLTRGFELCQNFPNPFNPQTNISFFLNEDGYTNLIIYNLLGEEISELINGFMKRGNHSINWFPENKSGGIYFYKLLFTGLNSKTVFSDSKKMIYIK